MFKLKSIELKNFLSHEHTILDFSNGGLYLLSGYSEIGGDSNGAGKSAIFSAISYALFGKTQTGLRSNTDITRWHEKKNQESLCEVCLSLIDGQGQIYKITRGPDTGVNFTINDSPVEGHKRDIQQSINEAFRTSYDLFVNINLFTSYSEFLTNMGDADRKQLLGAILGLDRLEIANEKIFKIYKEMNERCTSCNNKIFSYQETLTSLKQQLAQAQSGELSWEGYRSEKIQKLEEEKESLTVPNNILDMPFLYEKLASAQIEYDKWNLQRDNLHDEYIKHMADLNVATQRYQESNKRFEDTITLEGKCYVCGSPITDENLNTHRQELIAESLRQKKIIELEETLIKELEHKLSDDAPKCKFEEINKEIRLSEIENEKHRKDHETYLSILKRIEKEIGEWKEAKNEYAAMVNIIQAQIAKTEEELAHLSGEQKQVSSWIDIYGFLRWVLSKEGVASFLIERAFGRLESLTNKFLSEISSDRFIVEIRPQKELKSKAFKEEIDIVIVKGKKRISYGALSDGQRQRLNIAILFSLYMLCRDNHTTSFDFLLLDEILDLSLGIKGQEEVTDLLRSLSDKVSVILVVSHKEGISRNFDNEIKIRQGKDGISRII